MSPTITICIPNFNHGKLLGQTLDAVFSQNLDGVKVLVSDNASSDDSLSVIDTFRHQPQLRVLRQDSTIPMASNWNTVVKAADTPWIIMLCSDDLLLPSALSQLKQAAQTPDVQAIFFEYDFLVEEQRIKKTPFYQTSAMISGQRQAEIFLKGNNYPLSACMFKRDLLQGIGWFDESKAFCTDWHAWLKMSAAANQVLYIKEPLLLYRQHAENETHRCVRDQVALEEVIKMKTDFISEHVITDKDIIYGATSNNLKLAKHYASQMVTQGFSKAANYYLQQASLLEQQLTTIGTKPQMSHSSAPYPLPHDAAEFKSLSFCLT